MHFSTAAALSIPLSIALIVAANTFAPVDPTDNVQLVFPSDYSQLSKEEQQMIIQGHNYQTCVYNLKEKTSGGRVEALSINIKNTCNHLVTTKG